MVDVAAEAGDRDPQLLRSAIQYGADLVKVRIGQLADDREQRVGRLGGADRRHLRFVAAVQPALTDKERHVARRDDATGGDGAYVGGHGLRGDRQIVLPVARDARDTAPVKEQERGVDRGQPDQHFVAEGADDDLPTTRRAVAQRVAVVQVRVEHAVWVGRIPDAPEPFVVDRDAGHRFRVGDVRGQRGAVPLVQQPTVCDIHHIVHAAISELGKRRVGGGGQRTAAGRPCPRECPVGGGVQRPVADRHDLGRAGILRPRKPVGHGVRGRHGGRDTPSPTTLGRCAVIRQPRVNGPTQLIRQERDVVRDIIQPAVHLGLLVLDPLRHQPPLQSYFWSGYAIRVGLIVRRRRSSSSD